MVSSAQHRFAKWLADILEPVTQLYPQHCISGLFIFENQIQNTCIDPNNSFFDSFDIPSLYTNIPLDETIATCADILYQSHLDPTPVFLKLMHIAT